ncbi:YraN family protein [Bdellovibrio bacteriovorus]
MSRVTWQKKNNHSENHWSHQQGLESELRVIGYYEDAGFDLIAQRVKTPFAEVDLLFRTPDNHVLMVEVKTNNNSAFQNFRIGKRQKVRLVRALQFLADRLDSLVEVHWAFVTKEGKVTIIEDISG